MLQSVEIENYRCLRDIKVPLRPLTVLIGQNDTGKSSFLRALQLLSGPVSFGEGDYWRLDQQAKPRVLGRLEKGVVQWDRNTAYTETGNARTRISPAVLLQLPSSGIEMQSSGYEERDDVLRLAAGQGADVATVLDYFLRRDRERFFAIVNAVKQFVPGVEDLNIGTPNASLRRVELVIDNGLRIHADAASTGVRLMIYFVTLAFHPSPPRLILIEEPENGLHPRRLADVMGLLRAITKGLRGAQPAQVIVTTHSPYLLDQINLEEDQVLVFRRNDDGSRIAEPADAERLRTFLDEFMLGEVWYNQGEEGLVARRS